MLNFHLLKIIWKKKKKEKFLLEIAQKIVDESAEEHGRKSPEASRKGDSKSDVVISMPVPEMHSVGGVLAHMPQVHSIEKKKRKKYLSLSYRWQIIDIVLIIIYIYIHQLVITPAFKRHSSLSFYLPLCAKHFPQQQYKTQHAVRLYKKKKKTKKKNTVCVRAPLSVFLLPLRKMAFCENHLTR